MNRQQLEAWLCDGADGPSPIEIARLIGIPYDVIGDSTLLRVADRLLGVRFAIAVLRDVFADDRGVDLWLRAPRPELGELSALDLLLAGDLPPVEELAVREWNDAASAPADETAPEEAVTGEAASADAMSAAHGYRQSVGRSPTARDATSEASDDWPADPTFSTVWAV